MDENNVPLDPEEEDVLNSFNQGEWVSKNENLDKYKTAAKETFGKTHRINFRVSENDFRNIQIKARELGLPYQTLVSSIIHRYLTGSIKETSPHS
ncbi:MAG: antitoxin [Nitrospinae bacterium]|nr:antitoxin [Nitrospinota bacterium]